MLDFPNIERAEEDIGISSVENEKVELNLRLSLNVNFDVHPK